MHYNITIILFHGLGSSEKMLNYSYNNTKKKYIKNNFIQLLKKIDNVFIPNIPYTNVYYYTNDENYSDQMKSMYKPINELNLEDLSLDKYIKNLYNILDKNIYKPPYIVMGHSHGIYYAIEFAKQFKKLTKYVISLDGSWITKKLCNNRLLAWKKKGKVIPKIKNQKELNDIIDKIKMEKDNMKYINIIFDYVRGTHTKYCIKNNFEKINIPFITFRNFNSNPINDMEKDYNNNVVMENKILSNYNNHKIFILFDSTHEIWLYDQYKKQIINYLKYMTD